MKVSFRHILLCAALYLFVGIFGYLTFVDTIPKTNLILEYDPTKRIPFLVIIIALSVSTTVSLAFIIRPCKDSILVILYPEDSERRENTFNHYTTIMVLYIVLVIITFLCVLLKLNLE